jgi:AraC-like DNA-binding protein
MPIDRFDAELGQICGSFDLRTDSEQRNMRGAVSCIQRGGIEMAQVGADILQIVRSSRNIRLDAGENYFLILQEEGRALMCQSDTSCILMPGDMVLIDSSCPSEFTFFGEYSRQLSLHLPRAEMHARFGYNLIRGGIGVPRHDPSGKALTAVLGKILTAENLPVAAQSYLREALFGLLGAALCERSGLDDFVGIEADIGSAQDLTAGQCYINTHYRNPDLNIQEIADDLGMSIRQIQRGFASIGITPTKYLLSKRLEHARRAIMDRNSGKRDDLISSIAYEAGFSDLSYFQRTFRKTFGEPPGAFQRRAADGQETPNR